MARGASLSVRTLPRACCSSCSQASHSDVCGRLAAAQAAATAAAAAAAAEALMTSLTSSRAAALSEDTQCHFPISMQGTPVRACFIFVAHVTPVSVWLWRAPEVARVSAAVMCVLKPALMPVMPQFEYPRILVSDSGHGVVQGRNRPGRLKHS